MNLLVMVIIILPLHVVYAYIHVMEFVNQVALFIVWELARLLVREQTAKNKFHEYQKTDKYLGKWHFKIHNVYRYKRLSISL